MIALSFGAGRQTVGILVMILTRELPRPDYILFADTGTEWPETYQYIEQYILPACQKAGLEFVTVRHERLRPNPKFEDFKTVYDFYYHYKLLPVPFRRQCTAKYKIIPMEKFGKSHSVDTKWIGFSFEEQGRAKRTANLDQLYKVEYPLIDNRMTLADCEFAINKYGWPTPPKSSCYICCFMSPAQIIHLCHAHPELWERARALEDNAHIKNPKYHLWGNRPIDFWEGKTQRPLGGDWNYGCAQGCCCR